MKNKKKVEHSVERNVIKSFCHTKQKKSKYKAKKKLLKVPCRAFTIRQRNFRFDDIWGIHGNNRISPRWKALGDDKIYDYFIKILPQYTKIFISQ